MKILWVKAGKLLPVDTGGKIRSFNILRHLAREHEVTLLSYYGGDRDVAYEQAITGQLAGAYVVHTSAPEGGLLQWSDYLLRLPGYAPYAVRKFTDREVGRRIARQLSDGSQEVAVCDFLSASLNFPDQAMVPVVLFQHNVETTLWRRMAHREKNPLRKLSYAIEARKMARYEARALHRFQHVIAVSGQDREAILAQSPACPVTVVPTGVDTQRYQVATPALGDPALVMFLGSMDWEPNIDAVEYFCQEIWPEIRAAFPKARFQIVGRNPHSRVRRLVSESVELTGTVPSVTEYLHSATVVVVPLRIGGGTRLKIFEAMATGRAMVSTSIGAEGLDVTHGRDLLIADDPHSFAESVIRLLRGPELRRSYEQNAAALAAKHDWSKIAQRFAEVLQACASGFRRSQRQSTAAVPVQS